MQSRTLNGDITAPSASIAVPHADFPPTETPARSSAAERGASIAYPRHATVPRLFEAQATRRPEAIAVVDGGLRLTYAELNRRANRLANYLRARGISQGSIVGIYLPRGAEAIVAILAILKAGAAYLPLDTADPSQRVIEILKDANAAGVISTSRLSRRIEGCVPRIVALDLLTTELANCDQENRSHSVSPRSLCYVMFTSGSTGRPKGVMV